MAERTSWECNLPPPAEMSGKHTTMRLGGGFFGSSSGLGFSKLSSGFDCLPSGICEEDESSASEDLASAMLDSPPLAGSAETLVDDLEELVRVVSVGLEDILGEVVTD